jgi:predicted phage terminase large subunit-like protein
MAAMQAIKPQPGPQEMFLSTSADIAIYGGAAGGGKTWALLLEPLRHIQNPGFHCVGFRRTSPQIRNPGGLWDESSKLYPLIGATPHQARLEWHFPSGARVKFAHLQHEANKHDWQGSQMALILFDELPHFSESQFFYMLTRNRSTCGIQPYMRATCNPDADSWVARLIAWWIDQDTGYAIASRSGIIRWFVRVGGELKWADLKQELKAKYPEQDPKSLTFISASVYDNKILLKADPSYIGNLMAQPLVERERLLGGNWKIRPSAGKIFNRSWFEIVKDVPAGGVECRYWDFASTSRELAKNDPDFTAGVKMREVGGIYYVMHSIEELYGPAVIDRTVKNTADQDKALALRQGAYHRVRWEIEPGSAARRDALHMIQLLKGHDAKGIQSRLDKYLRAKPLATASEVGNVKLLAGPWNEAWLQHMHNQPEWGHDDVMDASSGAHNDLAQGGRSLIR